MQFIAECGIEYGCQFVTQFFFNPPDCLYIKKSCKFLQSYEKTSEMQKESLLFFSFPSVSNFGEAKVSEKLRAKQRIFFLFFRPEREAYVSAKKRYMPFAEKNRLFLKKSNVRFFQKQPVFFNA
jgi:hypothetical protein